MKNIPVRKIHATDGPGFFESFNIRDIRDLLDGKDMLQELHRHDFFHVLVLEKGAGRHEIDFLPYEIGDNCVFFMRPGQVHRLTVKAGSAGYVMAFNNDFYHPEDPASSQSLRIASQKNLCRPDAQRFKKFLSVLDHIFQEYTEKQEGYQEAIKANLGIFLIELIRQRSGKTASPDPENTYAQEQLEKLLILLEKNIATHKQASQYAQMLNLTPYRLNAITKTTLGKTCSEIIIAHIILESRRYLLATSSQVNQIAWHLGYEDVSYFIRFFKKHTGHTPEAFRHNSR